MMDDFETHLRSRYPRLYREPVVCGVEHPAGWNGLVEQLSAELEAMMDSLPADEQPYCDQTKQKFGELRYYYTGQYNQRVAEVVRKYEELSKSVCEVCGTVNVPSLGLNSVKLRKFGNYWLTTRCEEHAKP